MKKISIVTINYNNEHGLKRTIESVISQRDADFDYIVIDGGSNDGSIDVIEFYSKSINYWVSEPDNGIYNAMNKGVSASRGEYCLFLNSGDILASDMVISKALDYLNKGDEDIVSGYTLVDRGNCIKPTRQENSPKVITKLHVICSWLSHPSTFIRKSLLLKLPYNESLKIVSDWEFFINAIVRSNVTYKHIDLDIAIFNTDGISSANSELLLNERNSVLEGVNVTDIISEISVIPPELIPSFSSIQNSYRFKRLIVKLVIASINMYHKVSKVARKTIY